MGLGAIVSRPFLFSNLHDFCSGVEQSVPRWIIPSKKLFREQTYLIIIYKIKLKHFDSSW